KLQQHVRRLIVGRHGEFKKGVGQHAGEVRARRGRPPGQQRVRTVRQQIQRLFVPATSQEPRSRRAGKLLRLIVLATLELHLDGCQRGRQATRGRVPVGHVATTNAATVPCAAEV